MRIFLLGDFKNDNGPSIANRNISRILREKYDIYCSMECQFFSRIKELIREIQKAEVIIICSKSRLNYLAIMLAKYKKVKIIYLMHGLASYEARLNGKCKKIKDLVKYEDYIFKESDSIVCVSKMFMEYLIKEKSKYAEKFSYVYNTVDVEKLKQTDYGSDKVKKCKMILSVGGGMRRKNNLTVAKALENREIKYVIVGNTLEDGEKIKKISNVCFIEHLPQEKLFALMCEANVYVQNSIFETFGLSVLEALFAGCSVLISKNVGCIDLFSSISDDDIIYNIDNEAEIESKVIKLLTHPNNIRLMEGLKTDCLSPNWQITKWEEIINFTVIQ